MWAWLDSDGDFTFHRWFVTARSSACPSKIITLSPFQVPNALLWSVSEYLSTSESASQILNISEELCDVARSSLPLLSRQNTELMQSQSKRFCIKKCFGWFFWYFQSIPGFLTVFLFHCFRASLPPLRRVFPTIQESGKQLLTLYVPVNCIGILAVNCNASQLFLSINWQILFF